MLSNPMPSIKEVFDDLLDASLFDARYASIETKNTLGRKPFFLAFINR